MGFKISEQVNILAVSHQQDLLYSSLHNTEELSPPVLVTDLALSTFSLERQTLSQSVQISRAGKVSAVVYWFVQDFGWNLSLNTRDDSQQFRQAAVLCEQEIAVAPGDRLTLCCQLQSGLLDFRIKP